MKVLIIGGVAGGASAAARLRRLDEHAQIIILERGSYVSFANCGLPYYIGGVIKDKSKLLLQTVESMRSRFNIEVRLNNEVIGIDGAGKTVTVKTPVGSYTEPYDKLIIATGASPVVPDIPGMQGCENVFTVRSIDDADAIKHFIDEHKPKSALIIGGSYIGLEMAENLVSDDIKVTVAELADHLIAPFDFDMAADVHAYLREKGIALRLKDRAVSASKTKHGLKVDFASGGSEEFEMVIVSTGVKPDTSAARVGGFPLTERGAIITESTMKTEIPDVYAVGDAAEAKSFVTGRTAFIPLAGPANRQGRLAADNICGIGGSYGGTQGSSVLKIFGMTAAATGMSESALRREGIEYDKTYIFAASHATYYPGAANISMKLIWRSSDGKILGAQATGFDGVDKRIDVIATAMRLGAKAEQLASLELCYAPPYGSAKDPVNMLGFIAENIKNGLIRQFFWEDISTLPRDGSVTLLDVRTDAEYSAGHIEGFVHIPLDSLRERAREIPKDKTVYIHCRSGLRSYIACRMLSGMGYDCLNLAGGYRLYRTVMNELE